MQKRDSFDSSESSSASLLQDHAASVEWKDYATEKTEALPLRRLGIRSWNLQSLCALTLFHVGLVLIYTLVLLVAIFRIQSAHQASDSRGLMYCKWPYSHESTDSPSGSG
jgi:hypothetical protein